MNLAGRRVERWAALVLAALGGTCGLLLWRDAELVDQRGRRQCELLAQLRVARAAAGVRSPGVLPEFDGLFDGLRVVCVATPAGQVLQLLPAEAAACRR